MKRWILVAFLFSSGAAWSQTEVKAKANTSLQEELKELNSDNKAPAAVSREKLYAVQTRYLPLQYKGELTVSGGYNLTGDSFLSTTQFEAGYHFHFGDRWSVALHQAWVNNQFKEEAYNLRTVDHAIPDVPYSVRRSDLLVEYNLFYGKFRLGSDTVYYFDQFLALGPGLISQNNVTTGAAVADVGFAFWLGKWTSARLGLKDYYYNEFYRSGKKATSNLHAHLDLGVLF